MTKLVTIPIADATIEVEVARTETARAQAMGARDQTKEIVGESLEKSLKAIAEMTCAFKDVLQKSGAKTGELTVGLKFSAKGSLFVAETSADATLNLKLNFIAD